MKIGINALTVLKTLIKGPATRMYPHQPAKVSPATRGCLSIDVEKCIFCGLCRLHCPAGAIEVSKPDRTWQINQFRCVICGCCLDYCPKDCLSIEQKYLPPATEGSILKFTGSLVEEIGDTKPGHL